ncbi:MAG: homoserine dehydrogenase [Anaerolineales bacterium]|nr:homoserine dehydrogenase [Anaerolineales bacterium]
MAHYNLAFLGFGNVGRALAQLLESKRAELRERHNLEFTITGVAARRLGWHANPGGYSAAELLHGDLGTLTARSQRPFTDLAALRDWLRATQANVLFENTSMNPHTGQPAIDYIRTALEAGVHVVSANKGPVVHAYHELRDLAASKGVRFLHEAAVMGGAPIFSLFREALPAARLLSFRGILNSTTNLMLTEMEHGAGFDQAVKKAQDMGIAETDPSFDVDGWDATVKVSALATVLMDYALKPEAVQREGIRGLTPEVLSTARLLGRPYKLVCQAERRPDGTVAASVRPEQVPLDDPLARCDGATSILLFQMDVIHGLTLSELHPDAITTAYGPLADFITLARRR